MRSRESTFKYSIWSRHKENHAICFTWILHRKLRLNATRHLRFVNLIFYKVAVVLSWDKEGSLVIRFEKTKLYFICGEQNIFGNMKLNFHLYFSLQTDFVLLFLFFIYIIYYNQLLSFEEFITYVHIVFILRQLNIKDMKHERCSGLFSADTD